MTRHGFRQTRFLWAVLAIVVLTIALSLGLRTNSRATSVDPHAAHHGGAPMTEEAMRAWVDQWFSTHPMVGRPLSTTAVVGDTFLVGPSGQLIFDTDGNINTPSDTAKIQVGQAILWRWVSGSHTVTSGTGFDDPQAGVLFDMPSTSTATQFQFTFTSAGTFPFFCRPHDFLGMNGVVVVRTPMSVPPVPGSGITLGFTAGPAPNPSRSSVDFQFALREAGKVNAEVFDSRGRLVAVVLDREFGAGSHFMSWDGRTRSGGLASAGVYYLRLRLPDFSGTRPLVIER